MSEAITTELVKELREKTGISVMQCRHALTDAGGDMEKAIAILKKTSSDIALKKAGRDAKDGAVAIKTKDGLAVLVTLHCETDFVAKNEDFISLLDKLSELTLNEGAEKMKASAKEMIDQVIQKTGEKIELGEIYEVKGKIIGSYVHNSKKGVIVSLEGGSAELARDVAMHVAAMKPEYISKKDVSEEVVKTMTEIFEKDISGIEKPEEIKRKMLDGKISSYFKEKTLLDQPFIKDPNETVGRLLEKNGAKVIEVKHSAL